MRYPPTKADFGYGAAQKSDTTTVVIWYLSSANTAGDVLQCAVQYVDSLDAITEPGVYFVRRVPDSTCRLTRIEIVDEVHYCDPPAEYLNDCRDPDYRRQFYADEYRAFVTPRRRPPKALTCSRIGRKRRYRRIRRQHRRKDPRQ